MDTGLTPSFFCNVDWTGVVQGGPGQVGPFALRAPLGRGTQAEIWRAKHLPTHQRVAIRFHLHAPSPQAHLALRRRVHNLACLHHPALAQLYASGVAGPEVTRLTAGRIPPSAPFVVMEQFRAPLRDRAQRAVAQGRLDLVVDWLGTLLSGLSCLHANNLLHGDIKPSNAMVREDGSAAWIDLLDGAAAGAPLRRYAAPEELKGAAPSPATDVYRFALVVVEMLTGIVPHDDAPMRRLFGVTLPPWPDDKRVVVLQGWLQRALDPSTRFQNAGAAYAAWPDFTSPPIGGLPRPPGPPMATAVQLQRMAHPPWVGRALLCATLRDALMARYEGEAPPLFRVFSGPQGAGKSRLLTETVHWIRMHGHPASHLSLANSGATHMHLDAALAQGGLLAIDDCPPDLVRRLEKRWRAEPPAQAIGLLIATSARVPCDEIAHHPEHKVHALAPFTRQEQDALATQLGLPANWRAAFTDVVGDTPEAPWRTPGALIGRTLEGIRQGKWVASGDTLQRVEGPTPRAAKALAAAWGSSQERQATEDILSDGSTSNASPSETHSASNASPHSTREDAFAEGVLGALAQVHNVVGPEWPFLFEGLDGPHLIALQTRWIEGGKLASRDERHFQVDRRDWADGWQLLSPNQRRAFHAEVARALHRYLQSVGPAPKAKSELGDKSELSDESKPGDESERAPTTLDDSTQRWSVRRRIAQHRLESHRPNAHAASEKGQPKDPVTNAMDVATALLRNLRASEAAALTGSLMRWIGRTEHLENASLPPSIPIRVALAHGRALRLLGHRDAAQSTMETARARAKDLGDVGLRIESDLASASLARRLGHTDDALRLSLRAYSASRKHAVTPSQGLASALDLVTSAIDAGTAPLLPVDLFDQAHRFADALSPSSQITATVEVALCQGRLALHRGDLDEAQCAAERAHTSWSRTEPHPGLHTLVGCLAGNAGRYEEAEYAFQQAMEGYALLGHGIATSAALRVGAAQLCQHRYEAAWQTFHHALTTLASRGAVDEATQSAVCFCAFDLMDGERTLCHTRLATPGPHHPALRPSIHFAYEWAVRTNDGESAEKLRTWLKMPAAKPESPTVIWQ